MVGTRIVQEVQDIQSILCGSAVVVLDADGGDCLAWRSDLRVGAAQTLLVVALRVLATAVERVMLRRAGSHAFTPRAAACYLAPMTGEQAIEELERALQRKGLKTTAQRRLITEVFFDPQFRHDHPTVDTLYRQVKGRDSSVGFATVYRTMKLLVECGLASPRQLRDNQTRYEPESPGEHHDHLVCLDCGHILEFENEEIETLQAREAARHGFVIAEHRMVLYGRCQRDPCERRGAVTAGPVDPST